MLGMNAQAWNTPGGIYDRFAGLMGVLATAPNERRKIELARQSHADEFTQRKLEHQQDYNLKKMYYESLMGKTPVGTAAGNNLAWRQSVAQNPPPVQDILNDATGAPVLNDKTDAPMMVPAGTPNYMQAGDDTVVRLPDIRQQLLDEAKAKQMSAYLEATGHPWMTPQQALAQERGNQSPYAGAVAGLPTQPLATQFAAAPVDPDQSSGASTSESPYGAAMNVANVQPTTVPNTKLEQFKQMSGLDPAPEFVPDLLGPDGAKREAILRSMSAPERKSAIMALKQMGY